MDDVVQKLQKELFASRSAYATAQRSVVQLSGDLKDSEQEIETLKRRLQRQQADTTEFRTCKLKVEELEGTLLAQQRESKLLQSARAVLDEELTALRTENTAKSYEIANLQQSIALQKSKGEEQATQLMVLKNQVAELEDEVAAAENDAEVAREALREGDRADNTESVRHIESLFAEKTDLLKQLHDVKAERDQLVNNYRSSAAEQAEPVTTTVGDTTLPSSIEYTRGDVDNMGTADLRAALHHCLRLQRQYKHARDSLLSANRHESLQAERLRHDVDALASSLQESESGSNAWQYQCMSALSQIERLKEMLSEGADWVDSDPGRDNSATAMLKSHDVITSETAAGEAQAAHGDMMESDSTQAYAQQCNNCAKMQQVALKQAEKSTSLDLQLRAMCAQLLRSSHMAGQIGRSTLPMLYSIETRLLEIHES